ncbi:MAG: methyltransferase domain-containing protein [Syntrophobacteraceae bacterium]
MNKKLLDFIICPGCLPDEFPLALSQAESAGDEVLEGVLRCGHCGEAYPIKAGIADIARADREEQAGACARYEQPDLLSAYLWSHYADLSNDDQSTDAYTQWGQLLEITDGVGLDTGCATGRFSFEMARKCEFVIGIDMSRRFISTAREILKNRQHTFQLREEGRIFSERSFHLPESWDARKMDFLVADAHALPFRSGSFSCVASLNLVDKIRLPLKHLLETSRAARGGKAQLLISDPFSWSEDASSPKDWLGGKPDGEFRGPALDNIARLLSDSAARIYPSWNIAGSGAVWWKIRNHTNHYELIRSLYIKAER